MSWRPGRRPPGRRPAPGAPTFLDARQHQALTLIFKTQTRDIRANPADRCQVAPPFGRGAEDVVERVIHHGEPASLRDAGLAGFPGYLDQAAAAECPGGQLIVIGGPGASAP